VTIASSARDHRALAAGKKLSLLSILLALAEAACTIPAGVSARSIALLGFGLDSLIEAGSAGAVLWGISGSGVRQEARERISLRVVGALLLALAAYIAYHSIASLIIKERAHPSIFGIVVLVASLAAMTWLRSAKRATAARLDSHALVADAKQTEFCAYLSVIALVGLGLNAVAGWWWADPLSALVMIPLIVREGVEAASGKACAHD